MPSLRLRFRHRVPFLFLGVLLFLGPGSGGNHLRAQEREVTRLHVELGRLDEEKEKATARRDRKALARIEREIKQVLLDLRQARKAEREARVLPGGDEGAGSGGEAGASPSNPGEEGDTETDTPADPAPADRPVGPIPMVSRIRWEREQAARNQGSVASRPAWGAATPPPASAPVAAASSSSDGEGMGLLPRQKALIRELEAKVAELRTNLVDAEKAFFAMSPEEQSMMKPVFEIMQAQGQQAIADAEKQREDAVRGVQEAEATLEESERIRERSERLLRDTAR